ncbi:unnamed protein product [Dovyalis caffra]|uniref:Major facilitator superfamily (MFS) profile domain-containing protein n=1 Tax=Dovyalis caffra TaxID=77055 RepID=A0AAV1RWQ5_9ROSI|nr:unnamed protein product [Dovyalis caffra]
MEREFIEEETPTRPLLFDAKPIGNSDTPTTNSSLTLILVFSTLVALSGSFCYGCATGYSSPAEKGIMEDLHLSIAEYSVFGSLLTVGGMVGAIFSGKIADLIGRRKHAWVLDIGRLSIGLGVGFITYVVPVYIAEISPKNYRGRFTSAYQLMVACGSALFFSVGNVLSWRILSLIGAVLCLLQIAGLFFIPESPRWLAKIGREKEFEIALQRLRGEGVDISGEEMDIKARYHRNLSGEPTSQNSRVVPEEICLSHFCLMSLRTLAGNDGVRYYLNTIFAEANKLLQIPAAALGVLLLDVTGRRIILMVRRAMISVYTHDNHGYAFAFSSGMSGVPWVIMSEILPTNVKASAGSLVTLISWFCSWIVAYSFSFMMQWSPAGTFYIFAGMCALTFLFTWKFVPETKGRTLEEIQVALVAQISEEDC